MSMGRTSDRNLLAGTTCMSKFKNIAMSVSVAVVAVIVVTMQFQHGLIVNFFVMFLFWKNFYISIQPKMSTSAKSNSPATGNRSWPAIDYSN